MVTSARERFADVARCRDGDIDLAEAALWIAAEADPALDVRSCLAQIDRLAEKARARVAAEASDGQRVAILNRILFEEERFQGNREDYYDPRNSFLNWVLERRTGIPITLCLLYVEVARRVGLRADGISFPGHFLAKVRDRDADREIVVDAFEGRVLDPADCEQRLQAALGPDARLEARSLAAAGPREILIRILVNLKISYLGRDEYEAALACCDRVLLLAPDTALELRDRGLLYQRLECFAAALTDLERFLELAPGQESAAAIRALLPNLREQVKQIH